MNADGWISLHRKIINSKIWKKPTEWRVIWIFLLLQVNHETGEGYFDYKYIARQCGVSRTQVLNCLEFLRKENMITTTRKSQGFILKVTNFLEYQNIKNNTKNNIKNNTKNNTNDVEESSREVITEDNTKNKNNTKNNTENNTENESITISNTNNKKDFINNNVFINNKKIKGKRVYTHKEKIFEKEENPSNDENQKENKVAPAREIFEYWNSKGIIVHKNFEKHKNHISAALKNCSVDEIKAAIDNYYYVLSNPDKFYWTYKWQLNDFLTRGLDRFLPINFKESDYFKRVYKTKAELEEERSMQILADFFNKEPKEADNDK